MNEEEKQALEECKILMICLYDYMSIEKSRFYCNQYKIILELIEKQQKEIENYQILKDDIEGHNIVYVDTPDFEEKYISKDKIRHIRDKAECMDYYSLNDVIDDLSKLLGD